MITLRKSYKNLNKKKDSQEIESLLNFSMIIY